MSRLRFNETTIRAWSLNSMWEKTAVSFQLRITNSNRVPHAWHSFQDERKLANFVRAIFQDFPIGSHTLSRKYSCQFVYHSGTQQKQFEFHQNAYNASQFAWSASPLVLVLFALDETHADRSRTTFGFVLVAFPDYTTFTSSAENLATRQSKKPAIIYGCIH